MQMFSLFLCFSKSANYCINTVQAQYECSKGYEIITNINEFYENIIENEFNTLQVINSKDTVITVDLSRFSNIHLRIEGVIGSSFIISDFSKVKSFKNLSFSSIEMSVVSSSDVLQLNAQYLSLQNIIFDLESRQNINLEISQVLSGDVYSLQNITSIKANSLDLSFDDLSYIPTKNVFINVTLRESVNNLSSFAYPVNFDVQARFYNLTFPNSINLSVQCFNETRFNIYHNTNDQISISAENLGPIFSDKYTFFLNNGNLSTDFKRFNEGPRIYSEGQSYVNVVENSVFLHIQPNSITTLYGKKGTEQGSLFNIINGTLLLVETSKAYQCVSALIEGTGRVEAIGSAQLQQNGLFKVQNTVESAGIGENVTFTVANYRQLQFINAEFSINTISFTSDYELYNYYDFTFTGNKGIRIQNGLPNVTNVFKYNLDRMPTNEEAQSLINSPSYGICSPYIDETNSVVEILDSAVPGFSNQKLLLKSVFNKVDDMTCIGVQLTKAPMDVYPSYCFSSDYSKCSNSTNYLITNENATSIGKLLPSDCKEVTIFVEEDMTNAFSFVEKNGINLTFEDSNHKAQINFDNSQFDQLVINKLPIAISGSGEMNTLTIKEGSTISGSATINSQITSITTQSLSHINGLSAANVSFPTKQEENVPWVIFNDNKWSFDNGETYYDPTQSNAEIHFKQSQYSYLPISLQNYEGNTKITPIPIDEPLGGLTVLFMRGWDCISTKVIDTTASTVGVYAKGGSSPLVLSDFKEIDLYQYNSHFNLCDYHIEVLPFKYGNGTAFLHNLSIETNTTLEDSITHTGRFALIDAFVYGNDTVLTLINSKFASASGSGSIVVGGDNLDNVTIKTNLDETPKLNTTNSTCVEKLIIDWSSPVEFDGNTVSFDIGFGCFNSIALSAEKREINGIHVKSSFTYSNNVVRVVFEKYTDYTLTIIISASVAGVVIIVGIVVSVILCRKKKQANTVNDMISKVPLISTENQHI